MSGSMYVYDLTMPADELVSILGMALRGADIDRIAATTNRTRRETNAALKAHGYPHVAQMREWQTMLTQRGTHDVCFDIDPYPRKGERVRPRERGACPDCGISVMDVLHHAWRQHGMRAAEVRALMEAAS